MKKILIVEDDTSIRELLVEVLESEGYLVSSSINGADGIKSLESNIPDLILTDVSMPIMDGYTFKRELYYNPKWNKIPVVAMSAQDQAADKLADYGMNSFVKKPLKLEHLLKTLKSITRPA